MNHCDPDFAPYLQRFKTVELDRDGCVVYGLWPDLRLAYLNSRWFEFAKNNDGEPEISRKWCLGASILNAIPGELRQFYLDAYAASLASGTPWEHDYECSSPDVFRLFRQYVYPLGQAGLLAVHALTIERPQPAGENPTPDHVDEHGFVYQCSHCRRTKNLRHHSRWDWVPELVRKPLYHTSHGLCPLCFDFYHAKGKTPGQQ